MAKVEPTLTYGGEVVLEGAGFDEALADALERVEETGATFVHAFEDEHVIAGQGTIGLELAEQVPDVETVLIPVGGGGLAAGIATALRALRPTSASSASQVRPATATRSPTASPSSSPGELTMVDPRPATSTTWSRSTTTRSARRSRCCSSARSCSSRARARSVSPRSSRARSAGTGPVCAVISGGNIDPTTLISVLRHGMTRRGPLPGDAHAPRRPSGRADPGLPADRGRTRQHRPDRASARGRTPRGRRRRAST